MGTGGRTNPFGALMRDLANFANVGMGVERPLALGRRLSFIYFLSLAFSLIDAHHRTTQ